MHRRFFSTMFPLSLDTLEVLGEALLFTGLLVKRPYNKVFFVLLCSLCVYIVSYVPTRVSLKDYYLAVTAFARACDGIDYLIIRDAQNLFRYKDQTRPASELPLLQRAKWAFILFVSPRGVGWKHVHANTIPPHTSIRSRSFFILRTLLDIVLHLAIFSAAYLQILRNPACAKGSLGLSGARWTWRFHGVFTSITLVYVVLQLQHLIVCLFFVVCRLFAPEDCPPPFGSVFDCYNIRRVWGRAWHQYFRRPFLSMGFVLCQGILRLKLGSVSAGVVLLAFSFFATGAMHSLGEYAILGSINGGAMKFFCIQGVAIFAEVTVEEIIRFWFNWEPSLEISWNAGTYSDSKATGGHFEARYHYRRPRRRTIVPWFLRWLGYLYVILWLYCSMPLYLDPVLPTGVIEESKRTLEVWGEFVSSILPVTVRLQQW